VLYDALWQSKERWPINLCVYVGQDVEGALSPAEISDKLGLAGGEKGREWSVRGSCATKGDGLEEGLDWLVQTMQK
jgi:ADP-ribosylation factor-like protein 1